MHNSSVTKKFITINTTTVKFWISLISAYLTNPPLPSSQEGRKYTQYSVYRPCCCQSMSKLLQYCGAWSALKTFKLFLEGWGGTKVSTEKESDFRLTNVAFKMGYSLCTVFLLEKLGRWKQVEERHSHLMWKGRIACCFWDKVRWRKTHIRNCVVYPAIFHRGKKKSA